LITEHDNILDTLTGCFFNLEGKFLRDVNSIEELDWLAGVLKPSEYIAFSEPYLTVWKFLWKTTFREKGDLSCQHIEKFFFVRRVGDCYQFRVVEKTSYAGKFTDDFGRHLDHLSGEIPTALPINDADIDIGFLACVDNIDAVPLVCVSRPSSFKEAVESTDEVIQLWYNDESRNYVEVNNWHDTLSVSKLRSRKKKVTDIMMDL